MAADELLNLLARLNLAAGGAIILVVAIRRIARPWFGARLVYSLWLLPLLAMAAVLAPARVVTIAAQTLRPTASIDAAGLPFFDGVTPAGAPTAVAPAMLDARMVVALWLFGVVASGLVMILLQRRFTAEVRKGAIGPAVVGVIAPRIVTPADFEQKFNREEQALVLAHERVHIERQDSRLNGLSAAIQCLCWFNPLIHMAAHLMRIDQEMACDETVVIRFPDARRAYAQALVKAQLAIRPLPLGCYWPSGTEHPLLERIAMLKLDDLSRRRRLAGCSALAVLCAATGFAAWASQPPQVRIVSAPAAAAMPASPPEAVAPTRAAAMAPTMDDAKIAKPAAAASDAVSPEMARFARRLSPAPAQEAAPLRVAALDPPPGGDRRPPPGPRGDQPLYARPGAVPAPPGEAPAAALSRPWEPGSVINPTAMKTIDGVVSAMKWTYPSSEIWVRETSSGQMVMINTAAAAALVAAGARQTLGPGAAITVKGYPARNGSRLFADPADIVAGGKPVASTPTPGLLQQLSRRLAVCGDMPTNTLIVNGGPPPDPKVVQQFIAGWRADCDAKLASAGE